MVETDAVIYLMGPSALDRQAYRLLLQHESHLNVAVESDFAPVAVWAAMRAKPDLALVTADRATPEVHDAVQMIPRLRKQTRILVASASVDEAVLKDWGRCGIDGYVVKDGGVEELRPAVVAVLMGKSYFSAGVREAIEKGRTAVDGLSTLSPRESELFPLLARGMTLREAASKMTVSYKTADSYRTSLLRKLGVRDRVELARLAIRERIIDP
ncbi:MAG: LuxR C-terminal-related transcriptional regulator [Phycisphaerae bacterium]